MSNLAAMVWVEWRKAIRSQHAAVDRPGVPVHAAWRRFLDLPRQEPGGLPAGWAWSAPRPTWSPMRRPIGPLTWICSPRSSPSAGSSSSVLAISWVFGREFADGTLKDMLAVPVPRSASCWQSSSWWLSGAGAHHPVDLHFRAANGGAAAAPGRLAAGHRAGHPW